MDVLLYGPAASIGATDISQLSAQMEQATTALMQKGGKVDKSDLSWLSEHENATEWGPLPQLAPDYDPATGSFTEKGAADILREYQTQQAAAAEAAQDVKIPWYVYALGAGVLLLGGILLFGKKKK